jgi:hypothetical protein
MIRKPRFPKVLASLPDGRNIRAVGREGETLLLLIKQGCNGLRASDFPDGLPYRLSAYIADLRAMGVPIRTEREAHATGWHAVYVLESQMAIAKVDEGARHE